MALSVFDMFSIGVGPSSSHTVGPMRAANRFVHHLKEHRLFDQTAQVTVDLYGSLAIVGKPHGTQKAIMIGLEGAKPESVRADDIPDMLNEITRTGLLNLNAEKKIPFVEGQHLVFHMEEFLSRHSNGVRFKAYNAAHEILASLELYSIGGGFVVDNDHFDRDDIVDNHSSVPFPFETASELMEHCAKQHKTISEIMYENEKAMRSPEDIRSGLLKIWSVMDASIMRGMHSEETHLPGAINAKRRAPNLRSRLELMEQKEAKKLDPLHWINCYAIAVNEENGSGGRIVTAPTNGAAGIIPACLKYFLDVKPAASDQGIIQFLLTAAAIGILYKKRASISAAEVGCQGEVGVACSMAAAALCEGFGGTVAQVENAAEMGMEHHLGLTCDPIGGYVQIPCIERNAMGSVQAVNSARLSLLESGEHIVSLDQVIKTMFETGKDMQAKYKETALGGLAQTIKVNQTLC